MSIQSIVSNWSAEEKATALTMLRSEKTKKVSDRIVCNVKCAGGQCRRTAEAGAVICEMHRKVEEKKALRSAVPVVETEQKVTCAGKPDNTACGSPPMNNCTHCYWHDADRIAARAAKAVAVKKPATEVESE